MSGSLGRLQPPDWNHVTKFPLSALGPTEDQPQQAPPSQVPAVMGTNWYTGMDEVTKDSHGNYWIARGSLGSIRGGHCYALEPAKDKAVKGEEHDNPDWWGFYNQSNEGACVGFGCARIMSLLNRHRYDPWWLYDQARKIDGDPDPNHEGSTVRAGLEILRTVGLPLGHGEVAERSQKREDANVSDGISAYRWARSASEVLEALGTPDLDSVVILNSWGKDWPHRVHLDAAILDRLIQESGEAGVVTDR